MGLSTVSITAAMLALLLAVVSEALTVSPLLLLTTTKAATTTTRKRPSIAATPCRIPRPPSFVQNSNRVDITRFHVSSSSSSALSLSADDDVPKSNNNKSQITNKVIANKNILVIGGSGRVGGSVVCQLLLQNANVTVGGTRESTFLESQQRWLQLYPQLSKDVSKVKFVKVDREDTTTIENVLNNNNNNMETYDLVIHTAGPFQGKVNTPNGVLEAAVKCGVNYIDVCDDYCTARKAKTKFMEGAKDKGAACILSTGCWPGVSSLMAKQLTTSILQKNKHLSPSDLKVDFSFYTAGSGGAGSTLLVATFLILAEKSLKIVNGRRTEVQAMKDYERVDFGKIVGEKDIAPLNLLEAASVHDILGVGNVQTLFGTSPAFWNTLLGFMAQLPSSLLSNEPIMEKLALFSLPIVRIVDYFAGATNAMRCDVTSSSAAAGDDDDVDTIHEMALYAHENLEPCVGECVLAFSAAVLSGNVDAGVWFPEEAIDGSEDVKAVLGLAGVGAHTLEVESNSGLTRSDVWGSPAVSSSSTIDTVSAV